MAITSLSMINYSIKDDNFLTVYGNGAIIMLINVTPKSSLVDEPVCIQISGLHPGQNVIVRAKRTTQSRTESIHLSSHAKFHADDDGIVDLARQAPIDGTYKNLDPMGLFWSLHIDHVDRIDETNTLSSTVGQVLQPQSFTLNVESYNQVIGSINITRSWLSNEIQRIPIRNNGLVATLFCPKSGYPRPGVIFVGGSEGGLNEFMPSLLASHGFTTLALAYFGMEHLPKRCSVIPLEYVKTAIEWMQSRNDVIPGWLGMHGTSKGSQLALLSGSFFEQIKAVISLSGGAISTAGIVPWSDAKTLPPGWTYQGKPIPYATPENPVEVALECLRMLKAKEGNPYLKWYRQITSDPEIIKAATIPVERIQGPVMFISGQDDGDISRYAQIGVDRLAELHHPFESTHLSYPGGTHAIGIPYVRVTDAGRDGHAVAAASEDSWWKTKKFFVRSFSRSASGKEGDFHG